MNNVTRYLLALILVLSLCLVALEWNTNPAGWAFFDDDPSHFEAELELSPLHRDEDEIPMQLPTEPEQQPQQSDELHLVDEAVELAPEAIDPPSPSQNDMDESPEEQLPQAVDMYDEPVELRLVEELPQFPGGAVEFMKWLTKNLRYPASARQRKVQGRVMAQFIVNTDGSITELELVERLDPQCDREALRVLRMMPKWKAGTMDAKPCRTKVCIPIVFKL